MRLPQPALRAAGPRTAAQLALAGLGVAIVPFATLNPASRGTIRALQPDEMAYVMTH